MPNHAVKPEHYPVTIQVIDGNLIVHSLDFDLRVAERWEPGTVGQMELLLRKLHTWIAQKAVRMSELPPVKKHAVTQDFLSQSAAARLLRISSSTLRRAVEAGKLHPTHTPGGHRRYAREDLERYQRENP